MQHSPNEVSHLEEISFESKSKFINLPDDSIIEKLKASEEPQAAEKVKEE